MGVGAGRGSDPPPALMLLASVATGPPARPGPDAENTLLPPRPDAENTLLPPRLLQSPPHQEDDLAAADTQDSAIQTLCASSMVVPPPPAVLHVPTDLPVSNAVEGDGEPAGRVMRRSKRLAAIPVSSPKPASRARQGDQAEEAGASCTT
jgi:hypothetical protein